MAISTAKNQHSHLRPVSNKKNSSLKATIRDQSGAGRTRIGELLSKEGHITSTQLEDALRYQEKHSGRLGSILIKLGYIEEETIVNILNRIYNYPVALLSKITPDKEALELFPYKIAKKYMAFPLKVDGDNLEITMSEPTDATAVESLQVEVKKSLSISISTERDIIGAFQKHYEISNDEYKELAGIEETEEDNVTVTAVEDFGSLVSEAVDGIELSTSTEDDDMGDEFSAADAPIIKLVNGILIRTVNDGVSDIHIEPFEKSLQVRYRLDGSLFKSMNLPLPLRMRLLPGSKFYPG